MSTVSASEARANHIFCHIYFTILHQISHSIHTIPNILSSGSGSKSGWPWISPNRPPSSIHSSPMWTSANQSQKRHGSSSLRRFQHTSLEHTSQPFTTWLMKEIFSYLDFFGYLSEVCCKGSVKIFQPRYETSQKNRRSAGCAYQLTYYNFSPKWHPWWR